MFLKPGLGDPGGEETEKGSRGFKGTGKWNRVGEPGMSKEQGRGTRGVK